jgi:superfamily II DNA/RNA helicase
VPSFHDMPLPEVLLKALDTMQFVEPTPIQEQSIPLILAERDLLACAQTGTGKTAAFSLPMLTRLMAEPNKGALILAPTRELALQITEFVAKLTWNMPRLKPVLLIGGAPMQKQTRLLMQKPRVIVATPGRLVDHLQQRTVDLSRTALLVLDEADRMLDMGFAPQLREILKHIPEARQTLLFSATMPDDIRRLASQHLRAPAEVHVNPEKPVASRIQHVVIQTTGETKNEVLITELNQREGSVLIFARTKHRTDRLAKYLQRFGFSVTRLHGDRSQSQRESALKGFRVGTYRILVATDIAARGIDIPHIAHVINYDLPQTPEDYVHRIGRTARAGATGEALCLLIPEEHSQWRRIARMYLKDDADVARSIRDLAAPPRQALSDARARPSASPTPRVIAPRLVR